MVARGQVTLGDFHKAIFSQRWVHSTASVAAAAQNILEEHVAQISTSCIRRHALIGMPAQAVLLCTCYDRAHHGRNALDKLGHRLGRWGLCRLCQGLVFVAVGVRDATQLLGRHLVRLIHETILKQAELRRVLGQRHARDSKVVAIQTRATQECVCMVHEQRMKHGRRQLNMSKVSRAIKVIHMARLANIIQTHRTKGRVVQTALGRCISIVKQHGIHHLTHRDASHLLGGQEGE